LHNLVTLSHDQTVSDRINRKRGAEIQALLRSYIGTCLRSLFLCSTEVSYPFFSVFSIKLQTILQNQIRVKNVHPVSGARIQTHNLLFMSLLS